MVQLVPRAGDENVVRKDKVSQCTAPLVCVRVMYFMEKYKSVYITAPRDPLPRITTRYHALPPVITRHHLTRPHPTTPLHPITTHLPHSVTQRCR